MYFKKIFEQVKYFRKVFKYKYLYKCCYCNAFDHVYLKFKNASYLYLILKP